MSPNPADRPTAHSLLQHPAARAASQSCILEAVHDVCWGAPPIGTAADAAAASAAISNTDNGVSATTATAVERDGSQMRELDESPVPSNRFPIARTSAGPGHNSHVSSFF
jgi:hypothetical protein